MSPGCLPLDRRERRFRAIMEGICDEFRLAMEAIEAATCERIGEDVILGMGIFGGFGAGWS